MLFWTKNNEIWHECSKLNSWQNFTVDGKKTRPSEFCSHFMSFYPIDFIFIGWVGYDMEYFRVPRNFDFKPTNPIFSPKRQMNHFRKWPFLGVWCRKLTFRENGVMDMANMLDSVLNRLYRTFPNIFSLISAISANLSKSQKNHILKKKSIFFDRKWALERSKRVQ